MKVSMEQAENPDSKRRYRKPDMWGERKVRKRDYTRERKTRQKEREELLYDVPFYVH